MKLERTRFVELILAEARAGNPAPLIAHLQAFLQRSGTPLNEEELRFIAEALHNTAGKRYADDLRRVEQDLIALQVEGHMIEDGMSHKQAVAAVMEHRKRSRRHVYAALAAYRRRHRR